MSTKQHVLYRFYATSGELLYVGITMDPAARWRQHRQDKPWWTQVARIHLEVYPDRIAVLEAERKAIIEEKPTHNVIHNRTKGAAATIAPPAGDAYDSALNLWTFYNLKSGLVRTTDLHLYAEINGTPMSGDYLPEEITADELMRLWLRKYGDTDPSIYWYLLPIHESAPFQVRSWMPEDFLTFYSWPVNEYTGERLNWNRMPVADVDWTDSADKGGFFQEVTGWKPAPLQLKVPLQQVLQAAGLT